MLVLAAAATTWSWGQSSKQPTSQSVDPAVRRVTALVEELKAHKANPRLPSRTCVLSESDLNAYLADLLKQRKRRDLQRMVVRLGKNTFTADVTLDMNQVDVKSASTAMSFLKKFLSGRQSLQIAGTLAGDKGKGVLTLESARVNALSLPTYVLGMILGAIGRRQTIPFDIDDPFPLPYGIKQIRIEPGKATLQT